MLQKPFEPLQNCQSHKKRDLGFAFLNPVWLDVLWHPSPKTPTFEGVWKAPWYTTTTRNVPVAVGKISLIRSRWPSVISTFQWYDSRATQNDALWRLRCVKSALKTLAGGVRAPWFSVWPWPEMYLRQSAKPPSCGRDGHRLSPRASVSSWYRGPTVTVHPWCTHPSDLATQVAGWTSAPVEAEWTWKSKSVMNQWRAIFVALAYECREWPMAR